MRNCEDQTCSDAPGTLHLPNCARARRYGDQTKASNPKDMLAEQENRVHLALIPQTALVHEALALMDGARKYGAYNWRGEGVGVMTYISATMRHLADFLDGEEIAQDSKVHHLGHARACLGIILDGFAVGNIVDDRPPVAPTADMMEAVKRGSEVEESAWEPCMECGNRVSCTCGDDGIRIGTTFWVPGVGTYYVKDIVGDRVICYLGGTMKTESCSRWFVLEHLT